MNDDDGWDWYEDGMSSARALGWALIGAVFGALGLAFVLMLLLGVFK